jgi:hypothetical protein
MKQQMSINSSLSAQDRFGRQLAACLDASAKELPHDITERLRVARLQALGRYREVQACETGHLAVGGGVAALGPRDGDNGLWPRLVSLIPLLALVAGLVAIQIFGADEIAQELAEIDAAILADDLPPDAYADPGFAQFLRARLNPATQD